MKRKVRNKRKSVRVKTSRSKRVRRTKRTKKSRNVYRKTKRKSNRKSKNKMKGGVSWASILAARRRRRAVDRFGENTLVSIDSEPNPVHSGRMSLATREGLYLEGAVNQEDYDAAMVHDAEDATYYGTSEAALEAGAGAYQAHLKELYNKQDEINIMAKGEEVTAKATAKATAEDLAAARAPVPISGVIVDLGPDLVETGRVPAGGGTAGPVSRSVRKPTMYDSVGNSIACLGFTSVTDDAPTGGKPKVKPKSHLEYTLEVALVKDNNEYLKIKKRWSEVVEFHKQMLALLTEPDGWFRKVVPNTPIPEKQHNLQYHFHMKYPKLPHHRHPDVSAGELRCEELNEYFLNLVTWEEDRQFYSPGDSDLFADVPWVVEFFS
jgi:hypothetical protein